MTAPHVIWSQLISDQQGHVAVGDAITLKFWFHRATEKPDVPR